MYPKVKSHVQQKKKDSDFLLKSLSFCYSIEHQDLYRGLILVTRGYFEELVVLLDVRRVVPDSQFGPVLGPEKLPK